eukprot:1228741-Prymnesium_polylepis.1
MAQEDSWRRITRTAARTRGRRGEHSLDVAADAQPLAARQRPGPRRRILRREHLAVDWDRYRLAARAPNKVAHVHPCAARLLNMRTQRLVALGRLGELKPPDQLRIVGDDGGTVLIHRNLSRQVDAANAGRPVGTWFITVQQIHSVQKVAHLRTARRRVARAVRDGAERRNEQIARAEHGSKVHRPGPSDEEELSLGGRRHPERDVADAAPHCALAAGAFVATRRRLEQLMRTPPVEALAVHVSLRAGAVARRDELALVFTFEAEAARGFLLLFFRLSLRCRRRLRLVRWLRRLPP